MTCELTGGRYLLMIIDYSTFCSFKYCNGGLLRNFSFYLFSFPFFWECHAYAAFKWHSSVGQLQCSFVRSPRCEDDFRTGRGIRRKSVVSFISCQIQTQLRRVRADPNVFFFFYVINRSYAFQI